ncbi:hypothetical protein DVH24_014714 [Malus domestica]|uniref:MULE transposase domain-containing protein n=1 Tax=Malus domestica TaxID=3750 RepID=A0A498KYV4_MALDO|nr:hypothetical protein DVH24_013414 [Malus domestica]RXI10043.1 hypothetical protein DVH24_014714 [Malus domestica]
MEEEHPNPFSTENGWNYNRIEACTFRRFIEILYNVYLVICDNYSDARTSWKELLLGDVSIMMLLLLFPFFSTLHFLNCATRLAQGFFPLAFALVDVEDEANWTWFLMNLSTVLFEDDRTITFILDRHKGLLQSVANVFPTSPHGFCIYHIEKNIKTTHILLALGKIFVRKWSNYSRIVLIHPLQKCSTST